MAKFKKRYTRKMFQDNILGEWKDVPVSQYSKETKRTESAKMKQNGPYITFVDKGMKNFSDGTNRVQAKTWLEIAKEFGFTN